MSVVAAEARATGRVQGVAYRAWMRGRALDLGLSGWVRNEADGSVSAHIEGSDEAVHTLLTEMRRGPTFAEVRMVESHPVPPIEAKGFEIRR